MIQTEFFPTVDTGGTTPAVESGSGFLESLKGLGFEDAMSTIANAVVQFSFRLLIAILVFYIGKFIIRKLYNFVFGIMVTRNVDASLTTFVLSLIRMVLYFILIITVIGIIGIETSSFLALFASAGVAIGMALSGTLQNFAGGVLILLLKPYKVGDYIEAQGFAGTVREVQIFSTIITTPDNKSITIPNGGLSTGSINNYSREDYRRVDWTIGLSYGTDFAAAKEVILKMLNEDDRVVKNSIDEDKVYRQKQKKEAEIRREEENKKHEDAEGLPHATPAKQGWWNRFKLRREEKQRILHERLREQTALKDGLPTKQNGAPPFVALGELADSSINITVRVWTQSDYYWGLFFDMNQRFYTELPEHGFSFPFPQLDVHVCES